MFFHQEIAEKKKERRNSETLGWRVEQRGGEMASLASRCFSGTLPIPIPYPSCIVPHTVVTSRDLLPVHGRALLMLK